LANPQAGQVQPFAPSSEKKKPLLSLTFLVCLGLFVVTIYYSSHKLTNCTLQQNELRTISTRFAITIATTSTIVVVVVVVATTTTTSDSTITIITIITIIITALANIPTSSFAANEVCKKCKC
jgi:lipoprotein signal peptidase